MTIVPNAYVTTENYGTKRDEDGKVRSNKEVLRVNVKKQLGIETICLIARCRYRRLEGLRHHLGCHGETVIIQTPASQPSTCDEKHGLTYSSQRSFELRNFETEAIAYHGPPSSRS